MIEEPTIQRWAAGVEYNGARFHGWQKQKHQPGVSIQESLEAAISEVANHEVGIVCAGRTDSGVHASAQVIHFDSTAVRSDRGWKMGINTKLPDGICVNWVQPITSDFHARFSAVARRYRYFIMNKPVKPGLMHDQVTWWRKPLDAEKMHEAAQALLGEHDFTSFRARDCQANHARRTMKDISVKRMGDWVMLEVCANAFLYHMVRNIAGVLLPIGHGSKPVEWCEQVLSAKDRTKAGVTAPGEGLYFVDVEYPDYPDLPSYKNGPPFYELMATQGELK
ncbi:tRNA pseudouridine(38-40) synthase TruA [Oceaniserpentilla sp. 4NH20-0058]|uniref:tRNA pseudouridine(38-40) synthase TruA n=1 Tax=Oceaniserpentilla sp. 4NH20-0058 TaxID=3127660 RepID=UPI00310A4615